jgi:ElaB/YqjD/DUF883 family membrane-anchored ribosome-binding protein
VNQTVHDTTKDMTGSAKEKAQEVGSQAKDQAKGQVDARTSDAGEQLQGKADNLHAVGDQMRERGDDTFAQIADRVAGWTEDMARYLRDADADRMLGDVESYARRQPWAVAAGGLLLGFAASRVVRAGSERRSEALYGNGYGPSYDRGYSSGTGYGNGYGTAPATGTGYTTGAGGAGYESLEDDQIDLTRRYGVTGVSGSVAPEPPGHDSPSTDPVPPHRPVPDTDPAPLGDPVPGSDPNQPASDWSTGAGGTHVDR